MKGTLRKLFLFFLLGLGALHCVPMDPQEIEDLLDTMNQTRIVLTIDAQKDQDKSKKPGP